jgi:hypothetical protein
LHAVGPEVLAWLSWLVSLPCSIATKAAGMDASAWAAWVQAGGSILAIGAGFATLYLQNRHSDRAQEAERARRAEVVAYRISVWLSEVGTSVGHTLEKCLHTRDFLSGGGHPPVLVAYIARDLRIHSATNIDNVLPDLHYLLGGSGDIAQLDHLIRIYEAWLDRLVETPQKGTASELSDLCDHSQRQLIMMRMLHANAERHINPLVQKAIDGGR